MFQTASFSKLILITWLFTFFLSSCGKSTFTKLLASDNAEYVLKGADKFYSEKKYYKSSSILEQKINLFTNTSKYPNALKILADSYYNNKSYEIASNYYFKLSQLTKKSNPSLAEEADYKVAMSFFEASPYFELDQKPTEEAISAFKRFIKEHPNSSLVVDADQKIRELIAKLDKKEAEIISRYLLTESYKAAITTGNNFISERPNSVYLEDVMFDVFKSDYLLAINSIETKKEERFIATNKAYKNLITKFPDSKYLEEADKLIKNTESQKFN